MVPILPLKKIPMGWYALTVKREFPFQARVNGQVVMITGLHWSGGCYTTQGAGLLPLSITPIESSEPAAACVQSPTVESKPQKEWRRQGCFKQKPLTPRERKLRADSTRLWLRATLAEPMPAREVLKLARLDGIPLKGLKRAKKRLKITSARIGGIAWRGHWVWKVPA